MNLLDHLKQNPFIMAPMAGITDHAFRSFMKKRGSSVVVTELVSANGLDYKSERTMKLMSFDKSQHPVGIQLFGEDPETLARAAQIAQDTGCDFIDLNFGCPVPKVVKKGAGSAMLKDLPQLALVLRAVKLATSLPVTIKIRTGWDANSRNAVEVCNIAYNEGITWVAMHGRTRAQNYSGLADWEYIAEVKSQVKIPLLGNGDLVTPDQAVLRLQKTGCEGVLIGRGCLKNPNIFLQALALWRKSLLDLGQVNVRQEFSSLENDVSLDFVDVFRELSELIHSNCEPHIVNIQLKKFAAWFSSGYPGASQFRKMIFQCKNNDEVQDLALEFFAKLGTLKQDITGDEPFLMGGHG